MIFNSETNEYNQGKNDCVIVSVANFLKCDYNRVINALYSVGGIDAIERLPKTGVSLPDTVSVLKYLTKRHWIIKNPRRGSEKFTGIASWHKPGKNQGHVTILQCGIVKETNGERIWMDEYRKHTGYVLRAIIAVI